MPEERNPVAAAVEIANRVEGRLHERIELADLTQQLQARSDQELEHFLQFGVWLEDRELPPPPSGKSKTC